MTPPTDTTAASISAKINSDDLQWIKRAGWGLLGVVLLSWAGWVSVQAIKTEVLEDRQANHYQQLRDDIAEVKQLLAPKPGTTMRTAGRSE